jgi:hypothetical protein
MKARPTTLRILTSQVIDALTKNAHTRDSAYDERVVMLKLRQIANELMKGEWRQAYIDGERTITEHFIATYILDVKLDEERNLCYIDIPANYLNLPNHTGVQRVAPLTGLREKDKAMIPINPFGMDVYGDLNAGIVEGQWCYEVDRRKIWFRPRFGKNPIQDYISRVEVKVVAIDPEDTSPDDIFPLPPELHSTLIDRAMNYFSATQQVNQDFVNDNNDNSSIR